MKELIKWSNYRRITAITKVTEGTAFMIADVKDADVYCIPK